MPVLIPKNDIIQNDATQGEEEEVCNFKYDKRFRSVGNRYYLGVALLSFFSQYLQRWCLNQMRVSVDWVDRVHVCGSLAILSRWPTFLPPTCRQSTPCFSWGGLIHFAPLYLLSGQTTNGTTFLRASHFIVCSGSDLDVCAAPARIWWAPSSKQQLCQNPKSWE